MDVSLLATNQRLQNSINNNNGNSVMYKVSLHNLKQTLVGFLKYRQFIQLFAAETETIQIHYTHRHIILNTEIKQGVHIITQDTDKIFQKDKVS